MIIACSANALTRISQACFRRAAKADGRPLIIDGKDELARIRPELSAKPDASELVWNLDLTEAPVVRGDKTIGTVLTGYLYLHAAQFTVVMNSLDDSNLCRIGSVAQSAIRMALADCYICPSAVEDYLDAANGLAEELVGTCGMEFAYPYEAPADKTVLVANANRAAASGLTRTRSYHETFLFGENGAHVSHEPVDRYACYRLNKRPMEFKTQDGAKRRIRPAQKAREVIAHFASREPVAAVELRLKLVEDRFLYRNYPEDSDSSAGTVPECWRTVLVPLDAPLSWVHGIIQKTFNWYDYHLHRFSFLDFDAREAFENLFGVECGIEIFGEEPLVLRQAAYDKAGGHERFKRLTSLDDKWLMRAFAPYAEAELIHEDFPQAELPEDMPVGLALFGSARYEAVMGIEHLERNIERRQAMRSYRLSLREVMDKKAARDGALPAPGSSEAFAALNPAKANALYYNYDFGDNWELSIEAAAIRKAPLSDMPRVVDGAGHTPPEDCGGIGGFKRVIAAHELVNGAEADKGDAARDGAGNSGADTCTADELAQAEDLLSWAQNAVGWRPFAGAADLAETFDRPGRM